MKHFLIAIFLVFGIMSEIEAQKLVILHTNDSHSRIEPLPETDKFNPGLGGVVSRAAYVEKVRRENKNVLLLDAGDFLQGTPYFNMFKGEVEVEAMNLLKYDVATLGNHEFDYGLEVLSDVVQRAKFPIITANYDFSDTELADSFEPYKIFYKEGVKIGIFGINVKPEGLIASTNYVGMKFLPPNEISNQVADKLKNELKCDIVICLSHLGYTHELNLAENSRNIDIIIGGHSHTFMQKPSLRKNRDGNEVMVFQTSGRGVYVGRIDVELQKK